jgi:5-methylcytosine-specific restriction endonuclease McrA
MSLNAIRRELFALNDGRRFCALCGQDRYVVLRAINRRQPLSTSNSMLLCEPCAEHHESKGKAR